METSSALRSDPLRALWSTASRSSRRCSSPKDPTLEGAPTLSATTSSSVVIETIVSHFYLYIYRYLANVDVIILTWEHVLLVTYISRLIKDLLAFLFCLNGLIFIVFVSPFFYLYNSQGFFYLSSYIHLVCEMPGRPSQTLISHYTYIQITPHTRESLESFYSYREGP